MKVGEAVVGFHEIVVDFAAFQQQLDKLTLYEVSQFTLMLAMNRFHFLFTEVTGGYRGEWVEEEEGECVLILLPLY